MPGLEPASVSSLSKIAGSSPAMTVFLIAARYRFKTRSAFALARALSDVQSTAAAASGPQRRIVEGERR
jgi:hypothetical protein